MLNSNNKLMLALMLSSSFIAQELKSNQEEELVELDGDQEDSDEEKGISKGAAAIATGCATVAAVGIIVAACNKDKIKDFYDRTCNCPFKAFAKLEAQHHDEKDEPKKAILKAEMDAELGNVFNNAHQNAALKFMQSTAKATPAELRIMRAQLVIEQTSAQKALNSAEKSFNEAKAAQVPAVPALALVSEVPALKAELALDLVNHRIRLVQELMYKEINLKQWEKSGNYKDFAKAEAEAEAAERAAAEAAATAEARA